MVYYPAWQSSSKSPLQAHTFYVACTHVAGLEDMKYSSLCFLREISTSSFRLRLTSFTMVPVLHLHNKVLGLSINRNDKKNPTCFISMRSTTRIGRPPGPPPPLTCCSELSFLIPSPPLSHLPSSHPRRPSLPLACYRLSSSQRSTLAVFTPAGQLRLACTVCLLD